MFYLNLKVPSVRPKYVLTGLLGAVMVALYTIHAVKHSPSRGQGVNFLQLHEGEVGGAATLDVVAKALALWALIMEPMFGIQL